MTSEEQKLSTYEVILRPQGSEIVPDLITSRQDMEARVDISNNASLIDRVRTSIAESLRSEREVGRPRSYFPVLTVEQEGALKLRVFIGRELHDQLLAVAARVFLDRREVSREENLERVNDWLQKKVLKLLEKKGRDPSQGKVELA